MAYLLSGLLQKCPKCGEGSLFKSYLKRRDVCPVCGENFLGLDADDGPAWLTILLTGHIIVPTLVYMIRHDVASPRFALGGLSLLTTFLVLTLLPLTKGLFIAILWKQKIGSKS